MRAAGALLLPVVASSCWLLERDQECLSFVATVAHSFLAFSLPVSLVVTYTCVVVGETLEANVRPSKPVVVLDQPGMQAATALRRVWSQ